jgi:hypothetical protein
MFIPKSSLKGKRILIDLHKKGIYVKRNEDKNYIIPEKNLFLEINDINYEFKHELKKLGYNVIYPYNLSIKKLYSEIMQCGNQECNFRFKLRERLLNNNVHFRYLRKFKRYNLNIDFYFKDFNKLCIDLRYQEIINKTIDGLKCCV